MKIENLKLFTEYERQLKRKYPCSHPKIEILHDDCYLNFEHLVNGTIYTFGMVAPMEPKNGDVLCTVKLDSDIKLEHSLSKGDQILAAASKEVQFNESRKPMEMNVDNLITAATALVNKEN